MSPSILNKLPKGEATTTVCLCLIVKDDLGADESHCVLRCLESCKGFITHVSAVFTCKQDGEAGACWPLVRDWCHQNRVILYHDRIVWKDDFSYARNHSIGLAQEEMLVFPGWLLLLDCDEELRVGVFQSEVLEILGKTSHTAFTLPTALNQHTLTRINLIKNIPGWKYRFRHHETIEFDGQPPKCVMLGNPTNPAAGPHVVTAHDGVRSREPAKKKNVIAALRAAWEEEGDPHYAFYLGMELSSLTDLHQQAISFFECYCNSERDTSARGMIYYAKLMIGRLSADPATAELFFWHANKTDPTRPEALGELALLFGKQEDWPKTYLCALAAAQPVAPTHLEFFEPMWVQWRAIDILTVALINMGRYQEATVYLRGLLGNYFLPASERPRIQEHFDSITRLQ